MASNTGGASWNRPPRLRVWCSADANWVRPAAEVHEAADTAEAVRLCAGGDPELIGTVVQVYRAGWTLIGNALVRAETGKATMEVPQ